jgi:hypothetical protein
MLCRAELIPGLCPRVCAGGLLDSLIANRMLSADKLRRRRCMIKNLFQSLVRLQTVICQDNKLFSDLDLLLYLPLISRGSLD